MIIEEFLTLPGWVDFEGINFTLELFIAKRTEARICYRINYVSDESPHKVHYDQFGSWQNKLADPEQKPTQSFLYLQEGIETDADLIWGIRQCWYWLQERGLLSAVNGRPYG